MPKGVNTMATVTCPACKATIQAEAIPANCPACSAALGGSATSVAPNQSVAGTAKIAEIAPAPSSAGPAAPSSPAAPPVTPVSPPANVAAAPPAPVAPAAPASAPPPAESTAEKVLTGIDIGLTDISAIAKVIATYFPGTPVEAIFKLLGPAAGIGAAVLAQHLSYKGFDLSTLKDAEIL
jgi:hypothetical protein